MTGDADRLVGTHLNYFETMYDSDTDPWQFETSWYEHRKYSLTMAALPRQRYRRAVEPGCANGALTERLAERCDELFAFDFVAATVARARSRMAAQPHVEVLGEAFPEYWPSGTGDLVVWSEVAYYLSDAGWECAISGLRRWLDPGGTLVAVHYTGETNYPMSGAEVSLRLDRTRFLQRVTTLVDQSFTLGVWQRRPLEPARRVRSRGIDVTDSG